MCIAHTDLYLTLKLKVCKSEENTLCSNVIYTFPPLLPVDLGCHSQLWQCTFNVGCPTDNVARLPGELFQTKEPLALMGYCLSQSTGWHIGMTVGKLQATHNYPPSRCKVWNQIETLRNTHFTYLCQEIFLNRAIGIWETLKNLDIWINLFIILSSELIFNFKK